MHAVQRKRFFFSHTRRAARKSLRILRARRRERWCELAQFFMLLETGEYRAKFMRLPLGHPRRRALCYGPYSSIATEMAAF